MRYWRDRVLRVRMKDIRRCKPSIPGMILKRDIMLEKRGPRIIRSVNSKSNIQPLEPGFGFDEFAEIQIRVRRVYVEHSTSNIRIFGVRAMITQFGNRSTYWPIISLTFMVS